MAKKKVKEAAVTVESDEPVAVHEAEDEIEVSTEPAKPTVKELAAKFQEYPCVADRHPQTIEDWIANYNATRKALAEAVA